MKRIIAFLIAIIMLAALVSCGDAKNEETHNLPENGEDGTEKTFVLKEGKYQIENDGTDGAKFISFFPSGSTWLIGESPSAIMQGGVYEADENRITLYSKEKDVVFAEFEMTSKNEIAAVYAIENNSTVDGIDLEGYTVHETEDGTKYIIRSIAVGERYRYRAFDEASGEAERMTYLRPNAPLKSGFVDCFCITLFDDGRFSYYAGLFSSYIGVGNYTVDGDVFTLVDENIPGTSGPLTGVFKFRHEGYKLIYMKDESDNYMYVNLPDGAEFYLVYTE